jgi:heme/copper-type cytochrome/quinol oxidase subunit 3
MYYVLTILVWLLTIFGILLMTLSIAAYINLIIIPGNAPNIFNMAFFTQVSVSTLIVIVGFSCLLIVSTIRKQLVERGELPNTE